MASPVLEKPLDVAALAEGLRPALLRVARRVRQGAQTVGLSDQDAVVLGTIRANSGIGVCDLAEREQVSRPTMSAQIKRLVAAGLLTRSDDAQDGRRSGLALTPAGLRKIDAIRRQRNDWLAHRLTDLSADERERLAQAIAPLLRLGQDR